MTRFPDECAEPPERTRLLLPDPLAGDAEFIGNLLERPAVDVAAAQEFTVIGRQTAERLAQRLTLLHRDERVERRWVGGGEHLGRIDRVGLVANAMAYDVGQYVSRDALHELRDWHVRWDAVAAKRFHGPGQNLLHRVTRVVLVAEGPHGDQEQAVPAGRIELRQTVNALIGVSLCDG